jgi:thiol-disulfide isomerase/thioredoxin
MKHIAKFITQTALLFAVIAGQELSAAELKAGIAAPDFTFTAEPSGEKRKLSDYRGKPVALHFWATWCGPCVRELPLISELGASKADSLTVLAVNCGEQGRTVNSFISKWKLRLNLIMDGDGSISRLYGINAIPQTWLIDEDGIIRTVQVGAYSRKTLNKDISTLLKDG